LSNKDTIICNFAAIFEGIFMDISRAFLMCLVVVFAVIFTGIFEGLLMSFCGHFHAVLQPTLQMKMSFKWEEWHLLARHWPCI
jgi:hypothetical protein